MSGLQDLGATGHRVTLDGGNEWFVKAVVTKQAFPVDVRVLGPTCLVGILVFIA